MHIDSDSEEERRKRDKGLPKYTVRYKDMPIEQVKKIVLYSFAAFSDSSITHDKDIALQIAQKVSKDTDPLFEAGKKIQYINLLKGEGEWQCIVGKNFGASLTFESKQILMFDLPKFNKTILIFKSG